MKKTDLSQFNNDWFSVERGKLTQLIWYIINFSLFKSYIFPFSSIKCTILRLFGAKIGKEVNIKPCVNIKYPWKLKIGDYTWVGEEAWIDNLDWVTIGANCCISQGALILSGNHDYKKPSFDLIVKPIILEDGAWVGAKSTVVQGVTLKSHSILAVNSVATSDLDAYAIYQGNPAVKIRERKM